MTCYGLVIVKAIRGNKQRATLGICGASLACGKKPSVRRVNLTTEKRYGSGYHREAQWLYGVSGEGTAIIAEKRHLLTTGSLVLIERDEEHEICNTGATLLETLNLYVPPAYT